LKRVLSSSLGKKFVMALSGLFLIGFTLVHLTGNLLLYVGFENYNHYAHSLHARPGLVLVAELILFVFFLAHIIFAVQTSWENRRARPVKYEMRRSKQGQSAATPSAVMFVSGAIIFGFLILHLADFRFALRLPGGEAEEPASKALRILQDPISAAVYFIGSLLLGWHLWHGFQSAFQSLGLRHPKFTPWIQKLGIAFALLLGLGFASFPAWACLKKWGVLP